MDDTIFNGEVKIIGNRSFLMIILKCFEFVLDLKANSVKKKICMDFMFIGVFWDSRAVP